MKKRQRCGQSVEYAGFRFDTLAARLFVLPDRQLALLEAAAGLGGWAGVTPSGRSVSLTA